MSPPTPPLARQLRDATRDAHRALDRHPALQCLLAPTLTREAYGASLLALYPAHAELENRILREIARLGLRLRVPRRLPRLIDDLGSLGLTPRTLASQAATSSASPAILAGELYVLEGSRLGGQMIGGRLRRTLGSGAPHTFFCLEMAPEEWPRRLLELEALCPPGERGAAVAGARAAFDRFREQLDRRFPG
ncbi:MULTISPECIES: biliverdin-producing heme oxygenase [Halomonas]|uniref:Heme oxygenase n=1 Tax=Halomonas ventosae TaxID=229007 RepID=A0A4R6I140_9GAMM|nr:biliverdin-producing heme oxygenase [Halomonas ventosae]TDO15222.1 heme oxygenase [Halomonas ventosae]